MRNKWISSNARSKRAVHGFSLLELMVALCVFLIVGGAALSLFKSHVQLFTNQQNQSALNFTLRNAAAQLQVDTVNAGNGFYTGPNIAAWPVGITINNSNPDNANCFDEATKTYGNNCFDSLSIVAADLGVPLAHPSDLGANCVSTTSSTLFGTPVSGTPANLASSYKKGDQIWLVSSDGQQMTSVTLTKDAQVTGGKVKFEHNPTGANGQNDALADPFGISTYSNNKLFAQFCDDDWILKVNGQRSITYSVDTSDKTNPKLMRTLPILGTQEVVAEQIIGFKVGASIRNQDYDFIYDANQYQHDWTQIRAVRVTMIGRTNPGVGAVRNTFDGGPYRVQAVSIVVNPRNLSMNDQ